MLVMTLAAGFPTLGSGQFELDDEDVFAGGTDDVTLQSEPAESTPASTLDLPDLPEDTLIDLSIQEEPTALERFRGWLSGERRRGPSFHQFVLSRPTPHFVGYSVSPRALRMASSQDSGDGPVPYPSQPESNAADCLDPPGGAMENHAGSDGPFFSPPLGRFTGRGQPLESGSWLNRPYHFDVFVGAMWGDDLVTDVVRQNGDTFSGVRLGADLDHYLGVELRVANSMLNVLDDGAIPIPRENELWVLDGSVQYYPWGDARWRPFATIGLGFTSIDYLDHVGVRIKDTLLGMPIGIGMKYRARQWLTLRAELMDNIAFGSDQVPTMHNLSLTAGLEFRFGGSRTSYWPWLPGKIGY